MFTQELWAQGLARDSLLQYCERQWPSHGEIPRQQFAIDNIAIAQRRRRRFKLGKALGDQLLAA